MYDTLHYRLARAGSHPDLGQAMRAGQRLALARFGLEFLVPDHETEPEALIVAAEAAPGVLRGGLRFVRRHGPGSLPVERAVPLSGPTLDRLQWLERDGLGELCGLWVAPHELDAHLALRLVRLGLEAAPLVGLRNLVALGGQHSLPLAYRTGFAADPVEPPFPYPDRRFLSRLVWRVAPAARLDAPAVSTLSDSRGSP